MRLLKNTVVLVLLVASLSFFPACQRPAAVVRPRPVRDLEHFEGFIHNARHRHDPVLSDLYVRASRALESGDAKAAEELYRQVITKDPKDPDGYESLGASLYFQGKYEEAKAEYTRALEIEPESADALYGLGCVAHKQKKYNEAVRCLQKAMKLGKDEGLCHRVLGLVHDESGEKEKAIFHYQRAVDLDPTNAGDQAIQDRLKAVKQESAEVTFENQRQTP